MKKNWITGLIGIVAFCSTVLAASENQKVAVFDSTKGEVVLVDKVEKSKAEWKEILTKDQYHILREKGTERAFSGKYHDFHGQGIYKCAACGTELFSAEAKFDSGTGWPSFWQPIAQENVETQEDRSFFMKRIEVHCPRCGGHLGHIFDDGPPPTGKRYCINSAALSFEEMRSPKK